MPSYQVPYAPTSTFQPSSKLVDLLRDSGSDQAQFALQHGAIDAQLANTLGRIPGQAVQTYQEVQKSQIAQQHIDATNDAVKFNKQADDLIQRLGVKQDNGTTTIDRSLLTQEMVKAGLPLNIQAQTHKTLDEVDASLAKFRQDRVDHQADLAHAALTNPLGMTPTGFALLAGLAKANGSVTGQEVGALGAALAQAPDDEARKGILQGVRNLSEKYQKLSTPVKLGGAPRPGAGADTLVDPLNNGAVIASGDPGSGAPSSFKEVAGTIPSPDGDRIPIQAAFDATTGKYSYGGTDISKYFQPKEDKPKGPTAEEDARKYLDIQTKLNLKRPILPEEQAFAGAYEKNKTLGVDAAAAAAGNRQASAQEQQNTIQQNAQAFAKAQVARADIVKTVDTPYLAARSSADTLRDVVKSAQGGNMIAGSLQSLETTMAALRAQGFNRINTVEIGSTANAGSLWDHLQNWFGKAKDGQPIDPAIQKDMLEFADLLDKSAYKKYGDAHEAVNQVYQTKIPRSFPPPSGATTPPPSGALKEGTEGSVNGVPAIWKTVNGKTGWYAK